MKAIGTIRIEEGLELLNPEMEISKVNYDWVNHFVDIEILFTEGVYKHSRTFRFNTDASGELTTADILGFLSNHEVLGQFA